VRIPGELCDSAKKGQVCPDDLCRGADVTLCGFDKEFYESCIAEEPDYDREYDDFDDDEFFDCAMDRSGQCDKAGSEECDFECPIMADIHRKEARKRLATQKGKP